MSKFKVGDRVYCREYGIGTITGATVGSSFITVRFSNDYFCYYATDGTYLTYNPNDISGKNIVKLGFFRKLLLKLSGAKQ